MAKNSSLPVTDLRSRGALKDLKDSKLIVYESKWFPWSSRINFIPFRIFRGPPIPQTSNWSGTFFAVSYSKLAQEVLESKVVWILCQNILRIFKLLLNSRILVDCFLKLQTSKSMISVFSKKRTTKAFMIWHSILVQRTNKKEMLW